MNKKLTFGKLKAGDKFIGFPSKGDNSGHNVFIKVKPCYEKETVKIFKLNILEHPALEMNAMHVGSGNLAHFPSNKMSVIKLD